LGFVNQNLLEMNTLLSLLLQLPLALSKPGSDHFLSQELAKILKTSKDTDEKLCLVLEYFWEDYAAEGQTKTVSHFSALKNPTTIVELCGCLFGQGWGLRTSGM